jgi:hypothetical protein
VRRRIARRSHAAARDHSISHGDGRAQITPIGRGPDDPAHDQANAPNNKAGTRAGDAAELSPFVADHPCSGLPSRVSASPFRPAES